MLSKENFQSSNYRTAEVDNDVIKTNLSYYENLTLEQFIKLPDVVDFYTFYNNEFIDYIKDKPYIKVGTVLQGNYVIAYAPESRIEEIAREMAQDDASIYPFLGGLLGRESLDASGIVQIHRQPYLNLRGRGVLIGMIDTGIDYTNPIFRYEDGTTKIKYMWDQTGDGDHDEGVKFGAVYTQEKINEALMSDDPYSIVPQRDTVGHGTFLASIAGGRPYGDYYGGAAPDAEFIIVKLRKARPYYLKKYLVPEEEENVYESSDVALGISYILNCTEKENYPISICIGVGSNFGSHSGLSYFEQRITQISKQVGVVFSVAAGNEANTKHHVFGYIKSTGDIATIQIRVGENVKGFRVDIWSIPYDTIPVSVKSPTGDMVSKVPVRNGYEYRANLALERSVVEVSYFRTEDQRASVSIIDPTPGVWEITLYGDFIVNGEFHAWLPITGLVSPDVEFIAASANYTIVVPGTAIGAITCGAYNSLNNSLYVSSSWGPTTLPRMGPDLVAPGVNVMGVFPHGYGAMTGTSVAAAITTGAAALMLQWGIIEKNDVTMNNNRVRALIIGGCERDRNMEYPNYQWGYGRLNLMQAFERLRQMS